MKSPRTCERGRISAMSTKNDRFRNPGRPKGYIQHNEQVPMNEPDLVAKEENIEAKRLCKDNTTYHIFLNSGSEDDVCILDKFTSSDSENGGILEKFFQSCQKENKKKAAKAAIAALIKKALQNSKKSKKKKRKHSSNSDSSNDSHSRSTHGSYRSCHSHKCKRRREPSCRSYKDDSSRKTAKKQCIPSTSSSRGCRTGEYDKHSIKPPGLLYGVYHCDVCNISATSLSNYNSHMAGKSHQKALNAQNVVGTAAKSFIPTELSSKYPKPLSGYYRKKLNEPAKIQPFLDENLRTPCPGMRKIKEIQSTTETSYYCSLCDSHFSANSILSHLSGFKHQLNCLRYFRSDLYEKWNYKAKYQVEQAVADELRHIENKYGRGLVKVEKDFSEEENSYDDRAEQQRESDLQRIQKKSSALSHNYCRLSTPDKSDFYFKRIQKKSSDFSDDYHRASIPDPSKSGYYCRICDSHSNSKSMWQSHIVGKRHLANLKKAPGVAPSKCKYIAAPSKRAYLMDDLEDIKVPIVGLSQIREIRKPEIQRVTYNCFLCCACVSDMEIVDHVLSRKHRVKYLESIDHPNYKIYKSFAMQDSMLDLIVEEICVDVEREMGRGTPEVYYSKDAISKW